MNYFADDSTGSDVDVDAIIRNTAKKHRLNCELDQILKLLDSVIASADSQIVHNNLLLKEFTDAIAQSNALLLSNAAAAKKSKTVLERTRKQI